MTEILRGRILDVKIRKNVLINMGPKIFPPSYSPLKLVEKIAKCIVALRDFFKEL